MPDQNQTPDAREPKVETVTLDLCDLCLDGKGGICNVPGCTLCRSSAPDIAIRDQIKPAFPSLPDSGERAVEALMEPIGRYHARGLAEDDERSRGHASALVSLVASASPSSAGGEGDDELLTAHDARLLLDALEYRHGDVIADSELHAAVGRLHFLAGQPRPPVSSVEEGRAWTDRSGASSRQRLPGPDGEWVIAVAPHSGNCEAALAREGRDAPAREEWRVVDDRGFEDPGYTSVEDARAAAVQYDRNDPDAAPHRVQHQATYVTEWVDVPACEDGGDS